MVCNAGNLSRSAYVISRKYRDIGRMVELKHAENEIVYSILENVINDPQLLLLVGWTGTK
jgi:hypothetical protein